MVPPSQTKIFTPHCSTNFCQDMSKPPMEHFCCSKRGGGCGEISAIQTNVERALTCLHAECTASVPTFRGSAGSAHPKKTCLHKCGTEVRPTRAADWTGEPLGHVALEALCRSEGERHVSAISSHGAPLTDGARSMVCACVPWGGEVSTEPPSPPGATRVHCQRPQNPTGSLPKPFLSTLDPAKSLQSPEQSPAALLDTCSSSCAFFSFHG